MQSGSSQDLDKRTGSTSSTSNDERAVKLMSNSFHFALFLESSLNLPALLIAPIVFTSSETPINPGLYNTSSAEYMRWAKEGREVLGTPSYTVYSMLESEKKRLDTGDEVVLASPRESRLVCGLVLEHQRTSVSLFTDRFDSIPISTTFYRLHASKKEPIICYQQTV